MTRAESLVAEWQERLRLMDWCIETKTVRHYDIAADTLGNITPCNERKEATITLLDEQDLRDSTPLEHTIIHELLHLHFEPFWQDEKRVELEQAINLIAWALLNAKYESAGADNGNHAH